MSIFQDDNEDGENSLEEIQGEDGKLYYAMTKKGLDEVASWCRLQLEIARILPDTIMKDNAPTEDYRLALYVWFLVREAYEARGFDIPGVEPGSLFPTEWDIEDGR